MALYGLCGFVRPLGDGIGIDGLTVEELLCSSEAYRVGDLGI